ncbi:MAG: ABC transporter permease [Lachnospiraceae bacterium]|jgi:simple sugar transport system permease protein|nr:ABC transporter permease [Lachnospiraceae bacterium]
MKKEKVPSEKGFFAWLAKVLGHEKWNSVTVPIFTIILTLIVSSIFLLILGKNPLTAFYSFLAGNGFAAKASYGAGNGMLSDFFAFLNIMAPMLLAALAFIFAYRCGLFNIGIAGQMLMSGFMATILVGYNKALPAAVAKPLVIIVGLVVGGLLGAFVGFLKYRFNIHEVVSTIMINYIISFLTGFFINSRYVDSITRSSKICSSAARLTWTKVLIGGYYCNVPLGIVVALIMVFVVKFIFDRTVFGFDLRAVGSNRNAATYAGINVGKSIIMSMMLSGCLAGLAGVTYYLGYTNTIIPKTLAGMGYDAIATALLGNNTPVGAIFASVLITIFQNGANYMSSTLGVAKEIASVITGILLLFSACSGFFRYLSKNKLNRIADEKRAIEKARKEAESK